MLWTQSLQNMVLLTHLTMELALIKEQKRRYLQLNLYESVVYHTIMHISLWAEKLQNV